MSVASAVAWAQSKEGAARPVRVAVQSGENMAHVIGVTPSPRKRLLYAAVAFSWGGMLLTGCETSPPEPPPPVYVPQTAFDRAWNAALGGAQDAGVRVVSVDRAIGFIQGSKDGIDVTVHVARQADGSVRVQFDAKGARERDPGLGERFSKAYDRRMGR